jgi:hypothetical protein
MTPAPKRRLWPLALLAAPVMVAAVMVAAVAGLVGATAPCLGGGTALAASGPVAGPRPTEDALREIPAHFLTIYREAGTALDISWPFLASIGYQECGHGTGNCYVVNPSGCAGPMEMAYVRGSACSPDPSVPTVWERFRTDGDGDGKTSIFDPADAVFTAAKLLRRDDSAPSAGGSYSAYHQAACNYYGACGDAVADYADEVMARAVEYGFVAGDGGEAPVTAAAEPPEGGKTPPRPGGGPECQGGSLLSSGKGPMGPVHKASAPRHLAPLPSPPASAPGIECDARIIPDVIYLTRRFGLTVTACYGIHATGGEHPLGAAIDAVPSDGDWDRTMRTALALGWHPSCAASGVAPECARPPFRFIGYNGYPEHGDPAHCSPCGGGAHLHISWNTSASLGEPENRPRFTYEPAAWIEVFEVGGSGADADEAHRQVRGRRRIRKEDVDAGPAGGDHVEPGGHR